MREWQTVPVRKDTHCKYGHGHLHDVQGEQRAGHAISLSEGALKIRCERIEILTRSKHSLSIGRIIYRQHAGKAWWTEETV